MTAIKFGNEPEVLTFDDLLEGDFFVLEEDREALLIKTAQLHSWNTYEPEGDDVHDVSPDEKVIKVRQITVSF